MSPDHRRRLDFVAGNYFSFSRPVFDHLDYGNWAESIKTAQNPFIRSESDRKFGPWVRKTRPDSAADGSGEEKSSGISSPPLWKSASPGSRPNYRQEMMDLVRNLPETAYELSLRDIVESPVEETERGKLQGSLEIKKDKRRRGSSRNGSMGAGGFLLRLFMPSKPAVLGDNQISSYMSSGMGAKIWARPMAAAADGEWCNSEYGKRKSSNGSSNGSYGARGRKRWKLTECCAFLYRHRRSRSREL